MNKEVIFTLIYCLVTAGAFFIGKYVFPQIPESVKNKIAYLAAWAEKFVVWAREFKKAESGKKKMDAVIEQLQAIASEAGIEVTEVQLKAIAQTAYEAMKAGEAQAQSEQLTETISAPAVPTVVINTGTAAVATDRVPDGALQQNADGTVNVYDAAGNKVGTVSEEEAERAASNVDAIAIESNG